MQKNNQKLTKQWSLLLKFFKNNLHVDLPNIFIEYNEWTSMSPKGQFAHASVEFHYENTKLISDLNFIFWEHYAGTGIKICE